MAGSPGEGAAFATVYAAGLQDMSSPLLLRYAHGRTRVLAAHKAASPWCPGDDKLLQRCAGPTLDIGCGPGRLTVALAARGLPVLGVDVAPGVAQLARDRGALVLVRSVFDRLPGSGRWATALLAHGTVGIGGEPLVLLRRIAELLSPDGTALVELDPPGVDARRVRVPLEHAGQVSGWFAWAHVNPAAGGELAARSGLTVSERWSDQDRWFARLSAAQSPLGHRERGARSPCGTGGPDSAGWWVHGGTGTIRGLPSRQGVFDVRFP